MSREKRQSTGTHGHGCYLFEGEMSACAGRVDNSLPALYTFGRAVQHMLDNTKRHEPTMHTRKKEASFVPLLDPSIDELLTTTRAVRQRLDLTRPVEPEV